MVTKHMNIPNLKSITYTPHKHRTCLLFPRKGLLEMSGARENPMWNNSKPLRTDYCILKKVESGCCILYALFLFTLYMIERNYSICAWNATDRQT